MTQTNRCSDDRRIIIVREDNPVAITTDLVRGESGTAGDLTVREELTIVSGQTTFNLISQAVDPTKVLVFVNGQKQQYSVDWQISSSGTVFEWLNDNFQLESDDIVEIYYAFA